MSDLKTNLELILNEKQTKIIPENIKSGITIFDIEGELETGVDTSDATALAEDIVYGKTAYVDGEKIEGIVFEITDGENHQEAWNQELSIESRDTFSIMKLKGLPTDDNYLLRPGSTVELNTRLDIFTDIIELTPEKIVEGNTILNIEGTAKVSNSKISNCAYLFYLGRRLEQINEIINLIDDSCEDFSYMFYEGTKLTEVPLFNTSNGTTFTSMFYQTRITELPAFDTSNGKIMSLMFSGISTLTTIPLLDFGKAEFILNAFQNCFALTNLGGFKDLGKAYTVQADNYSNYTLNLVQCNLLTHDSLMNVINNLYDLNLTYDVANGGTLYTQTLNIGNENKAKLTEEEIAIATNKGWTVL